MILGNGISSVGIAMNYVQREMVENRDKVETYLAFGASRFEACKPVGIEALKLALLPTVNQLRRVTCAEVGRMMTGAIVGGKPVEQAAKLQMIIMFMIAASSALSTLVALLFALTTLVDSQHRIRLDRLDSRRKNLSYQMVLPQQTTSNSWRPGASDPAETEIPWAHHRLTTYHSHEGHPSSRRPQSLATRVPPGSSRAIVHPQSSNHTIPGSLTPIHPRTHPPSHPSRSRPPPATSSTLSHRVNLTNLDCSGPSSTNPSTSFSTSMYSPTTPTREGNVTRRRLSNPPLFGSNVRSPSQTSPHRTSPVDSPPRRRLASITRPSGEPPSFAWLTNNLMPAPALESKYNKSDDERESDDVEKKVVRHKKRRNWFGVSQSVNGDASVIHPPSISMTPPSAESQFGIIGPCLPVPSSLSPTQPAAPLPFSPISVPLTSPFIASSTPFPQDLDNVLLPGSPLPSPPISRYHTPYHTPYQTPRPSSANLFADYNAGPGIQTGQIGSGGSPRTSISISSTSSRLGWGSTNGRSASRSSTDDEESPTFGHSRSWWWGNQEVLGTQKLISSLAAPSRPMRLGLARRLLLHGMRRWRRLMGMMILAPGVRRGEDEPLNVRQWDKHRGKRESIRKGQTETVRGSIGTRRLLAIVPTAPWSITLFFLYFLIFAVVATLTLKHILNPDKEALPWRSFCASDYPTLYSLQHPHALLSPASALEPPKYNSPYDYDPLAVQSVAPVSPSELVLAPLPPGHLARPENPHSSLAQTAETFSGLGDLKPVGIFIGVFTTDQAVQRRQLIRQSYASHWRSRREGTEGVRVRFIMGRPRRRYSQAVQLEMEAFDDIVLLDIRENMNAGKTHAFFSWAAENATVPDWEYPLVHEGPTGPVWRGEKRPAYVVKADEDSFIMLGELEWRLRAAPRTKAYWGYLVKNRFMAGESYALSFDLVHYIASSASVRSMTHGKEDKLVSKWIKMHPEREKIVWVAENCWIYDHPKAVTVYSHGFLFPSTVAEIRSKKAAAALDLLAVLPRGATSDVDAYSTVSRYGTTYRPISDDLSAVEQVEALTEGSPLSILAPDDPRPPRPKHTRTDKTRSIRHQISRAFASRPTRNERFLGDPDERGGTVVVHYIKKPDWFIETMLAFLGNADERDGRHRHMGITTGLGALESRKERVV
ncbi:MAG: hypothetical protein TREMPRED_003558 [Tremellales sp. Tagirdzhanova-0007]|nr:MAG: hypothetical protein TREMPRED_003558 [Tremellales sp. Tagirdzhanova-0007]